ncbi:MFS-type transporter SLC18B1 [Nymphon striatum]|nr:MFS-type transporter SLC18B1 [Nymphon striatum]
MRPTGRILRAFSTYHGADTLQNSNSTVIFPQSQNQKYIMTINELNLQLTDEIQNYSNTMATTPDETKPLLESMKLEAEFIGEDDPDSLYQNKKFKRKLEKRDYVMMVVLSLDIICHGMGYALTASFYPIVAQTKGLTLTDVGIVVAALPVATIAFGIVFSYMLPKIGTRRMLLSSYVIEVVSLLPFAFVMMLPAGLPFYSASVFCRIGQGIAFVASQIAAFSIAAGDFHDRMATMMGMLEMSLGVGLSLGPAAGGFLYDLYGFSVPFYFLAAVSAFFFVITYIFVHPTYTYAAVKQSDAEISSKDDSTVLNFKTIYKIPELFLPLSVCTAIFMNWTFFDVSLAVFMSDYFGVSASNIGLILLFLVGIYAFLSPIIGIILEKYGHGGLILVLGCFIAAPAFIFIGPIPILAIGHNIWLTMAGLIVIYFASALMYIPGMSVCFDMALKKYFRSANTIYLTLFRAKGVEDNVQTRSFISGAFVMAGNFGNLLGPFLGGVLMSNIGFEWTSLIYGCFTFIINYSNTMATTPDETKPLLESMKLEAEFIGEDDPDSLYQNKKFKRKLEKRDYVMMVVLSLDIICHGMGYALTASFYPIVAQTKGLTLTDVGIVVAALPVATIAFGIVFSYMLPKIGTRRMLLSSYVIEVVSLLPFAFVMMLPAGLPFYSASVFCRIGQGIAFVASQIAAFSIAAGDFHDRMATMMGMLEMSLGVGLSLGPAAGGFLYDLYGFSVPFYFLAAVSAFFFVITYIFVHPTYTYAAVKQSDAEISSKDDSTVLNFKTIYKIPELFLPLSVCTAIFMNWTFFDVSLAVFMSDYFGVSASNIGLILLFLVGIYAFLSPIIGIILEKYGHGGLILVLGCFIAAPAFIFIGPIPILAIGHNIWLTMAGLIVIYFASALMYIPGMSVCFDMALKKYFRSANTIYLTLFRAKGVEDNVQTRSFISGAFVMAGNFGNLLGPFLGGVLMSNIGFEWTSLIYGCFTFIIGLLSAIYLICNKKKSKASDEEQGVIKR